MKDIYYIYLCSTFYVYPLVSGSVYATYFLVQGDHIESHHIEQFSNLVRSVPRSLVCSQYTIKYDDINSMVMNDMITPHLYKNENTILNSI